ncbi:MAG: CheR family methyltransferase, partial [Chthoniobacterales bacterium]
MNSITPIRLTQAEDLLRQWIGLDPSTLGHAAISRAVLARMTKLGVDNAEMYLADVTVNDAERNNLIEEVVVPESWFFRDPQVYSFLKTFASERAAIPGRSPVRILSAPCAAGQEPYSIAMCLLDAGMSPDDMAIDAIEISHVCLGKAGAAEYSANAFRTADLSFRDRWFTRHDGAFALQGAVRRCVRFNWANVLDEALVTDSFASGRAPYDIIFCRNLLIYLTPAARGRVEQAINSMLQPDG